MPGRRSPRINPSSNEPALRRNLVTMSNVLIGIIGVILFIGLALAGALFLGPRFQESTNNSRASASVQAVSQIASAANMFEVQEGRIAAVISDAVVDNDALVEPGYRSDEHTSALHDVEPVYRL